MLLNLIKIIIKLFRHTCHTASSSVYIVRLSIWILTHKLTYKDIFIFQPLIHLHFTSLTTYVCAWREESRH